MNYFVHGGGAEEPGLLPEYNTIVGAWVLDTSRSDLIIQRSTAFDISYVSAESPILQLRLVLGCWMDMSRSQIVQF